MPEAAGDRCTASFNSSCRAWSRAGGNHRSARISGLPDHPPQTPTPIALWYAGPVPRPPPWPLPSGPGPATALRTTFPALWASAPGSSAAAGPWSPSPTVPETGLSLSLPSPHPSRPQRSPNSITSPIYPTRLRISPWLWFRIPDQGGKCPFTVPCPRTTSVTLT